jgi:hypothetical protein
VASDRPKKGSRRVASEGFKGSRSVRSSSRREIEVEIDWTITIDVVTTNYQCSKKMLFREKFKINVVINGGKTKYQCRQHFLLFEKSSKSMSSSMEAKSNISVVSKF